MFGVRPHRKALSGDILRLHAYAQSSERDSNSHPPGPKPGAQPLSYHSFSRSQTLQAPLRLLARAHISSGSPSITAFVSCPNSQEGARISLATIRL